MFKLLSVRESICYGVLMQSKGLLALIIFNDAYDADIISKEMFSILVAYVLVCGFLLLIIL
jgi:Kef-type K+ transport system membrane component KefB